MDRTQISYQEAYKRISTVAHSIRALCKGDNTSSSSGPAPRIPTATVDSSTLNLPIPAVPSILNTIKSPEAAASISDAFMKSVREIRQTCLSKFASMATFLASDPNGSPARQKYLVTFIERQYRTQILAIEKTTTVGIQHLQQPGQTVKMSTAKPTFNQEFVPLLDKYFEYNAYPSALDRASLAKKSMMTPRQIEVWFQNHRNRAKKEGRVLRRLKTDSLPHTLSLESLKETMPLFIIPEDQRKNPFREHNLEQESNDGSDEEVEEAIQNNNMPHISLNNHSPPHAFPTPFPPLCDYEPFPTKAGQHTFPVPVWRRTCATALSPQTTVDVNDLIMNFATKLVITDSPSKNVRQNSPGAASRQPWYASTRTIASSAPHPAFIRSSYDMRPMHPPTLPSIAVPSSRLHPFRPPSPSSHPTPLTSVPNGSATRRKVAGLPKRIPKHTSVAHRGASPAISEPSPSPSSQSLAPSSRTSSFSSDGSSLRRTSSSSSISSTASSTLMTPVFSHTSLPENAPSPISISGIDFQNMNDVFGDLLNSSPLYMLGLDIPSHADFNVPTIPGKDNFQFGFELPPTRLLV